MADGFEMFRVKVVVPPEGIEAAPKDLLIVGGWVTVKVAVLDVVPVPPFVELTAPVVLAYEPAVAESTFTEIVQVLLAATVPPLSPTEVLPAAPPLIVPPQLLLRPGVLATTRPEGKESLTARPVRATVFAAGFVIVRDRTEVAPMATLVGAKALAIVGATSTAKVAVAAVPVPSPEVFVTLPVLLVLTPDVVAVTLMPIVQLLLAAIDPALRASVVAPAVLPVTVPPQVLLNAGVDAT